MAVLYHGLLQNVILNPSIYSFHKGNSQGTHIVSLLRHKVEWIIAELATDKATPREDWWICINRKMGFSGFLPSDIVVRCQRFELPSVMWRWSVCRTRANEAGRETTLLLLPPAFPLEKESGALLISTAYSFWPSSSKLWTVAPCGASWSHRLFVDWSTRMTSIPTHLCHLMFCHTGYNCLASDERLWHRLVDIARRELVAVAPWLIRIRERPLWIRGRHPVSQLTS